MSVDTMIQWKPPALALVLIALSLAIVLAVAILVPMPPEFAFPERTRSVRRAIARLEAYKHEYGTYPDPRRFVLEDDSMFYTLNANATYVVGFDFGFDSDRYCYESGTRRWYNSFAVCQPE
jgi:hypothetical protein